MSDDTTEIFEGADDLPRWRRLVPIMLAVIFALALGTLIYRADHASEQRELATALQRHSYQVLLQARTVEARIGNAEALLSRYVLGHEAQLGLQFQDEWSTAGRELVTLERATRNNSPQTAAVARLRNAMAARGKTLGEIALRVRYAQYDPALDQLRKSRTEPAAAAIATELRAITSLQERERARHDKQVESMDTRVNSLNDSYGIMGLGLLLAVVAAFWVAHTALNERIYARRLAASESSRVDDLEAAVQQRTEQLRDANANLHREMEDRLQAEQSLRQLHKMEALGKLTGGIAHDFNNMLAVVIGGIDVARRQMSKDPAKAAQSLESATEGANHAAALIERLLAFARAEPLLPDRLDVDKLIAGMEDLVARAIGSGVKVELALDAGDWAVWVDRAQLESALINMAINARDAMDGRGALGIGTSRITLKEHEIGLCGAGDHICLTVTDSGHGMTPEVLERVFEPFFTTKEVGKGTGLGMSQIFGFISQCRGAIAIDSAQGEGTSIKLYLPRMTARDPAFATVQDAGRSGRSDAPPPARAAMTILVVEDDARVLRSTMAALGVLGHAGIACEHPAKAARLLDEHGDIGLILSDVLMPDMSGPELIAALGARIAGLPVVFVTGYAGDKALSAQTAGHPMLRKPFTVSQLADAIEEAMTGERDARPAAPVA